MGMLLHMEAWIRDSLMEMENMQATQELMPLVKTEAAGQSGERPLLMLVLVGAEVSVLVGVEMSVGAELSVAVAVGRGDAVARMGSQTWAALLPLGSFRMAAARLAQTMMSAAAAVKSIVGSMMERLEPYGSGAAAEAPRTL
jgi:hypothetical protein